MTVKYFLLLIAAATSLTAQTFNTVETLCDSCRRDVSLRFESAFFFKNNEYSNDFSTGFTGIGYFAKPGIEYYLTNRTRIYGGVYLLHYSGTDRFKHILPLFTIQHRLFNGLEVVLGTIYGTLNHQLEEPLFRFDRYYQKNIEYGIQFLGHWEKLRFDVWLNWQRFIDKGDPFQESFVVGANTQCKLIDRPNMRLTLPLQILISHRGGEIDRSPRPANTILNGMIGAEIQYPLKKNRYLAAEILGFRFAARRLPEQWENVRGNRKGLGLFLKAKYEGKWLAGHLGYWNGRGFIAPMGEFLYQSVSESRYDLYSARRRLLVTQLRLKRMVSRNIRMEFRTNAYYDTALKQFSYAYGMFFVINDLTFLYHLRGRS